MAEKTAKKKPNIFVRIGRAIVRFFKDTRGEMKRIVWPSGKQVRSNLVVVLVFTILMATLIFLLDLGFSWLIKLTVDLAEYIKTQQAGDASSLSSSLPAVSNALTSLSRLIR